MEDKFAIVRAALTTLLTEEADFSIFITFDGIEHQFPPAVMKEHGERGYLKLHLGPIVGVGPWEVKGEFVTLEVSFYGKKTILDIPYENVVTIQMHKDGSIPVAAEPLRVLPPLPPAVGTGPSPAVTGDTARVITGPWGQKED